MKEMCVFHWALTLILIGKFVGANQFGEATFAVLWLVVTLVGALFTET